MNLHQGKHCDNSGAKAAFRGYYTQTLYILQRVISGNHNLVFQPEKEEDLAIFDHDGKLIEVVQVKDYSTSLKLSDLGNEFFIRCKNYIEKKAPIRIVSFGELGPELKSAKHENKERNSIVKKLIDKRGLSRDDAKAFLDLLTLEEVNKSFITEKIESELIEIPFAAYQKDITFDILTHMVFIASCDQTRIKYQNISEKLKMIIEYLRGTFNLSHWSEKYPEIYHLLECCRRLGLLKYNVYYFSKVSELAAKINGEDIGIDIIRNKLDEASTSGLKV